MKVWLCTKGDYGDYSDYSVTAIYSTKEKADFATRRFMWGNDPIEYEIDALHIPDKACYPVYKDLKIHRIMVATPRLTEPEKKNQVIEFYGNNVIMVEVMAFDEEHAEKIAIDLFTQHEAREAGIV